MHEPYYVPLVDADGNDNHVGDYTPQDVEISYTAERRESFARIIVNIVDVGPFFTLGYGGNGRRPLLNGIDMIVRRRGRPNTTLTGRIGPIKTMAGYSAMAAVDVDRLDLNPSSVTEPKMISVRASFFKTGAELVLWEGDRFVIPLKDNFGVIPATEETAEVPALLEHKFYLHGHEEY